MTTAAFAVALALIVTGVAMIFLPAGLIVAGLLAGVCAVFLEAGAKS